MSCSQRPIAPRSRRGRLDANPRRRRAPVTVRCEIDPPVALITIDRAERRNAIDPETSQAVAEALARVDREPGVRVGIITGAGDVFCAGADLKAVAAGRLHEILEQPGGFCG